MPPTMSGASLHRSVAARLRAYMAELGYEPPLPRWSVVGSPRRCWQPLAKTAPIKRRVIGIRLATGWQPRHLPVAFAYSAPATCEAPVSVSAQGNVIAEIAAKDWQPYLATPAFPAYVSAIRLSPRP